MCPLELPYRLPSLPLITKTQMTQGRGQKAEVGGQKAEGRSQRAEVRGQKAEGRSQRAEVRGQKSEVRRQRAEVRGQKSEGRRQSRQLRKRGQFSIVDSWNDLVEKKFERGFETSFSAMKKQTLTLYEVVDPQRVYDVVES